jgi:hypothetical protein
MPAVFGEGLAPFHPDLPHESTALEIPIMPEIQKPLWISGISSNSGTGC